MALKENWQFLFNVRSEFEAYLMEDTMGSFVFQIYVAL